jgi:endonuclease IV
MNLSRIVGGHIRLEDDTPRDSMFQCFLTNSHGHYAKSRIEHWTRFGIRFDDDIHRIVHASYVTFPWSEKEDTAEKSIKDVYFASRCANILGIWGLNVHLPKEYHLVKDFEKSVKSCFEACEPPCVLIFEIVGSSTLYVSEGKLPTLPVHRMKACQAAIEKVTSSFHIERDRWGFCFDTAHAFVQGQPLTTQEDAEGFLAEAEGLNIAAIHLNGSLHPFRSGRDQHTPVASVFDYIWGEEQSGLRRILRWIVGKKIPTVLERPGQSLPSEYEEEIAGLVNLLQK